MPLITKRRLTSMISVAAVVATLTVAAAPVATMAAAPPEPHLNGFESAADVDSASRPNDAMFNVTQIGTGTDGMISASGAYHARAAIDSGAFTRYGGYSGNFPAGG